MKNLLTFCLLPICALTIALPVFAAFNPPTNPVPRRTGTGGTRYQPEKVSIFQRGSGRYCRYDPTKPPCTITSNPD